jgi:hypothetical protein
MPHSAITPSCSRRVWVPDTGLPYASVAPLRVVGCHLDDQPPQLGCGRWSTTRTRRLAPVAGDASSMPAQQCVRCHQPSLALGSRQRLGDRCRPRPVDIGDLLTVRGAVEHCELVAKHDDLEILRTTRPHSKPGERGEEPVQDATHLHQHRPQRRPSPAATAISGIHTPAKAPVRQPRPHFRHPHPSIRNAQGLARGEGSC